MIELFACLGSGNCFKPWLALKQRNIPFKLRLVAVLSRVQESDCFLQDSPLMPATKAARAEALRATPGICPLSDLGAQPRQAA